jgi:Undecaprenyl-phosphate galactose phosphotransferase WbaP
MSTRRQITALALGDALALAACAALAWWVKSLADPGLDPWSYLRALPALLGGTLLIYASLGLYPAVGWGAAEELRRVSYGTSLAILAGFSLTFLAKSGDVWSRQVFLVTWALALVAVPLARALVRRQCCRMDWWGIPCAVLGAGSTGQQVVHLLRARPWLGLAPVAVLDDDPTRHGQQVGGLAISGPVLEQAATLAEARQVRHAILAMPGLPPERLGRLLDGLGDHLRHVFIAPALPGSPDVIAEAREFANTLVLEVRQNLLRPEVRVLKRALDIVAVTGGLLLFGWLFAGLALAVKLTSPGPVFYGQKRIGRGGHEFMAWKFRSMVKDADAQLKTYLEVHPELREEWERDHKLKDDPRVTWIGRLLRRTSLDELPQLWNILRGDMSLVGPRPIVQDEVAKYGERFALFCKVRPGLSGLWQVSGRNDTTYAERVALDCYYVRNWSVWLDLVILARTVRVVLLGKGAY